MKTVIASYSELDTLRQCLFKHELGYKERWSAPQTGPALSRGILWHQVMETHYRMLLLIQREQASGIETISDRAVAQRIFDAVKVFLHNPITGQQSEEQELIEWMYRGHVEYWGLDPQWEILAVEHAPEVWLVTANGTRSRFRLKMKIDLIVRERSTRNIWVVDHKSGKDLPKDKELDLDDQFGLYTWGLRQLGHTVHGSIHSAARTHRNKDQTKHPQPLHERFARKPMYRTDRELDVLALEAYRALRQAYAIPVGEAPRSTNPDTCRWRCNFTEACLYGRKGLDHRAFLRDTGFVQDFQRH